MDDQSIRLRLRATPQWSVASGAICRTFEFKGFAQSIAFVNRVAEAAEKANHHPDIDIRWNQVTLRLTTHDQGEITEKDFSLAEQCNRFLSSAGAP